MPDIDAADRPHAEFRFETPRLTRWLVLAFALTVETFLIAGLVRQPSVWDAAVTLWASASFRFWIVPMLSSATISTAGVRVKNLLRSEVIAGWDEIAEVRIVFGRWGAFCRATMLDGKNCKILACTWIGSYRTVNEMQAWLGGRTSPLRAHYTPRRWDNEHLYQHHDMM